MPCCELELVEVEVLPVLAAQFSGRSGPDPNSIAPAMAAAFTELMEFIGRHGLTPSGPPRTIYTSYGPEGTAFIVAMPIVQPPAVPPEPGSVTVGHLAGAKTWRFTHHGPYRNLLTTYGRIGQFMLAKGLMHTEADWARYMPMWEEYVTDPQETPEAELRTYIHVPVAASVEPKA